MSSPIDQVVNEMHARITELPADHYRFFHGTYSRTTLAVGKAIEDASFEDPEWVERWDIAFAQLYLDALDARIGGNEDAVPRPWRLAFDAEPDLPPLRHVLFGINAHVNYDLPQALLAVITNDEFTDPRLMQQRQRDHARIDGVLASRVSAEDDELKAAGSVPLLDRALTPFNRLGTKRFLVEARRKVWHNTLELQHARLTGERAYTTRLAELEVLSAAKVADLRAPGQVILRLATTGFGVVLPPL